MRLIDADKLKEVFNSRQMYTGAIIKALIDNQSTAFYHKYVLEELEEKKDDIRQWNDTYTSGQISAYDRAIEIVKAGGIDVG